MDYDICDPAIRCETDKIGASIFFIDRGNRRVCRVLAYSQRDAGRLVKEHSKNERPADEASSLFDGL